LTDATAINKKPRTASEKFAEAVRILSAPPMVALYLMLILWFGNTGVFVDTASFVVSIVCLFVLPFLAYPIHAAIPKLRAKGRDLQRKMAFAFNLVGYIAFGIYAYATYQTPLYRTYALTYVFTVVILTIVNKAFKFKASGHAATATSPATYLAPFYAPASVILGIAFLILVAWSSLKMKRHTLSQFIGGIIIYLFSFGLAYLIAVVL
jgi:membrane-associated phospholipid phosphatase